MRIGVNVPGELIKRIEPIRPLLNVSQICRDAIETYARNCDRAARLDEAALVEAEAARLLGQERRVNVDWEDMGYHDGKAWAEASDLEDFEDAFHNLGIAQRNGGTWQPWMMSVQGKGAQSVKNYWQRHNEHAEWYQQQCAIRPESNPFQEAERLYTAGWLAYVGTVWKMIQDRREEQRREWEAAMRKTRESRPAPRIPKSVEDEMRPPRQTTPLTPPHRA